MIGMDIFLLSLPSIVHKKRRIRNKIRRLFFITNGIAEVYGIVCSLFFPRFSLSGRYFIPKCKAKNQHASHYLGECHGLL